MWEVINRDYHWIITENGSYIMGCGSFVEEARTLCEIHNRRMNIEAKNQH